MIETHVEHNTQSENLPLTVIDGNRPNLLGMNWLEKILQNHSELFCDELGCLNAVPAKIYIVLCAQPNCTRPDWSHIF